MKKPLLKEKGGKGVIGLLKMVGRFPSKVIDKVSNLANYHATRGKTKL